MMTMISAGAESLAIALTEALRVGDEVKHFDVRPMRIDACIGCSSCSGATYGRCILKDDMQSIYPFIVHARALLLVGPVSFGSYCSAIKRVFDRVSATGDPRYHVAGDEMVKGSHRKGFRLYAIGTMPEGNTAQQDAFVALHQENIRIMHCAGFARVLVGTPTEAHIAALAKDMLHG